MDFELGDTQLKYQALARKLVKDQIGPRAAEVDETADYPWDNVKAMAEAGLYRIPLPRAYGGLEEGFLTVSVIQEELAKACPSTALTLVATWLGAMNINIAGTPEQKKQYLPPLSSGEFGATMGLTEPVAGSDLSAIETEATLSGNEWVLNGMKIFAGGAGTSKVYIIAAKTNKPKGVKGISLFIVEKGFPGFQIGKIARKMGFRGQPHGELIMKSCRVPKENMLGALDEGIRPLLKTLNIGRLTGAAESVGIAQAAYDEALAYSKRRITFGQPISEHQAIQFMLVDMAMGIKAARLMTYQAATVLDQKKGRGSEECSMAKLYASEMVTRVTHKALQVHGGIGYLKDYPMERFYRDARAWEIMDGTSEIQRLIIARELLR